MNTQDAITSKRYETDDYFEHNPDWHVEDSAWKATQIHNILTKNNVECDRICEIGCGAGQVLNELQKLLPNPDTACVGYDIAPRAIELAQKIDNPKLQFECVDLLSPENEEFFDLLLVIDVFEHVPDYLGFLERCRTRATWKIYHIPLEVHVSSVFRNQMTRERYTVGHIHYYNFESAIATLKDSGHEIVDWMYTAGAIELYRAHPSMKRALANLPRWVISRFSTALAARLLGGYSLLVLAK